MVVTARIAAFTDMIPLYSPVCIFVVIPEQQIVSWAIASFFATWFAVSLCLRVTCF